MQPRLSRTLVVCFVVLTGASLIVLTLRASHTQRHGLGTTTLANAPATNATTPLKLTGAAPISRVRSGPWGDLQVTPLFIEPLESAAVALIPTEGTRWVFPQQSPVGVERIMDQAGMARQTIGQLEGKIQWDPKIHATVVTPDAALVIDLPAAVREALYAELARFPINSYQSKPFRFRLSQLDQWFESSRLSPDTISILRRIVYTRGDTALISDVPAACELIASPQEQARMLKVLARTSTLMLNLQIRPDSDVDALTAYWGVGKRLRDVRPLLESLTRVPGGHSMDVAHLLPRFARKRLYAYPARDGKDLDPPYDCHWSSLNFWNDPPNDRLSNTEFVVQIITSEYKPVPAEQLRFGDVVLLGESENELIHSCVYIADDIVFTKNGPSHLTPWVLMELDDLLAYYQMPGRSAVRGYRANDVAER